MLRPAAVRGRKLHALPQEQAAATAEEVNELRARMGEAETNTQRLQRLEDKRAGEAQRRLTELEVGSRLAGNGVAVLCRPRRLCSSTPVLPWQGPMHVQI